METDLKVKFEYVGELTRVGASTVARTKEEACAALLNVYFAAKSTVSKFGKEFPNASLSDLVIQITVTFIPEEEDLKSDDTETETTH